MHNHGQWASPTEGISVGWGGSGSGRGVGYKSLAIVWQICFSNYILSWSHFELIIEPRKATAVAKTRHATNDSIFHYTCILCCFHYRLRNRLQIPIPIQNLLSNLDLNLNWAELDAASLNLGLCGSASLASLVMCDCFQRPQLVLEIELGALNAWGKADGGWCCCNSNGCGNWGEGLLNVLCASPLGSCCVLYLFVASFNLVFLIWNFT